MRENSEYILTVSFRIQINNMKNKGRNILSADRALNSFLNKNKGNVLIEY